MSRRLGAGANVPLTLEDIDRIGAVLGIDGADLVANGLASRPSLPRLDSNQQPSGYPLALVRPLADVIDFAARAARRAA